MISIQICSSRRRTNLVNNSECLPPDRADVRIVNGHAGATGLFQSIYLKNSGDSMNDVSALAIVRIEEGNAALF
jgi:hypothetical protein